MAGILRKIVPLGKSSSAKDDDDSNVEYSFAIEYHGPPVTFDIPKVVPVDVDRLPTAAPVSSSYVFTHISLPVIQPLVKAKPVTKHNKIGSEPNSAPILSDSDTTESVLNSPSVSSSEVFSQDGENRHTNEPTLHVKRPSVSVVTFRDPESCDVVQDESNSNRSETESIHTAAQSIARAGKKGSCYRCLKGNMFTEKEVCIVCDAKFCYKCVLRAMGSMPEGRKCVSCIGKKINESKRASLGKSSRMLKRLLNELEVRQAMSSEKTCKANQLPPELVAVNGEPLNQDELHVLQTCRNPPKKLKPGLYWYDKVSGFWGKEGQGPCQIITAQLNVGGQIKAHASKGNAKVILNNREITRNELWMLQIAGVNCEGKPSFWLSADGSYQEEGQNNEKGPIWKKTRVKLFCALLSLPVPPNVVNPAGEGAGKRTLEQQVLHKILLVGYQKSGTSTIYNQAKILYNVSFSEDERRDIKSMIQSNFYGYLAILLKGRERFEEVLSENRQGQNADGSGSPGSASQIDGKSEYRLSPRLEAFSNWLIQMMLSGTLEVIFPAATREYAPYVQELWNDAAFRATYNRRHELEMLPRAATYFLEQASLPYDFLDNKTKSRQPAS
ncbi:extra-large G-protein 1 [Hibiscus trionum]|uniref:Extra-large G-protein 1 n=1 Tax=Hibiscus trionum TaxID=183268 RepID=A0A9W7I2Q3_HIBTR|nr:extra-large G-protein 1 [Hibiscus trionum]